MIAVFEVKHDRILDLCWLPGKCRPFPFKNKAVYEVKSDEIRRPTYFNLWIFFHFKYHLSLKVKAVFLEANKTPDFRSSFTSKKACLRMEVLCPLLEADFYSF